MTGKESSDKKKQLKTLVTFHSEAVFDRATAEQNTSALIEALLARHFGIEIEGNSVQAQLRRVALGEVAHEAPAPAAGGDRGGLSVPIVNRAVASASALIDEIDEADGDLEDDVITEPAAEQYCDCPFGVTKNYPHLHNPRPDAQPPKNTAETGAIVPVPKAEPEPLPDRPSDLSVTLQAPAFAPAGGSTAPAAPVEPAPAATETLYAPGTRICPSCGNNMGASPYCLVCL